MQVHDELIVECPLPQADKAADLLRREMEQAVSLSVKLLCDVHCGETWYEAKEYGPRADTSNLFQWEKHCPRMRRFCMHNRFETDNGICSCRCRFCF